MTNPIRTHTFLAPDVPPTTDGGMPVEKEPVGDYTRAVCPECEVEYGYHDDGDCPDCGTELTLSVDRGAHILAAFEAQAREIGREHALSLDGLCIDCVIDTPLARSTARDVTLAEQVDRVIDHAEDSLAWADARLTDHAVIAGVIEDAYIEAYWDAVEENDECWLCIERGEDR